MNYSTTSCDGSVEILASNYYSAIPITVAAPESGTIVKAGTPLTIDGASTTGSGAVGILIYDVDTVANPNGSVIVRGIIDSVKAQEHSGVTYASALYTALPGIQFRDNIGVPSEEEEVNLFDITVFEGKEGITIDLENNTFSGTGIAFDGAYQYAAAPLKETLNAGDSCRISFQAESDASGSKPFSIALLSNTSQYRKQITTVTSSSGEITVSEEITVAEGAYYNRVQFSNYTTSTLTVKNLVICRI